MKEFKAIVPKKDKWCSIVWQVNDLCNFKCSYCSEWNWGGRNKNQEGEVILPTFERILDHYLDNGYKYFKLFLSGGEPSLWKQLVPVVELFRKKVVWPGSCVGINTNFSRPLKWWEDHHYLFEDVVATYHPEFTKEENYLKNFYYLHDKKGYLCARIMMHKDRFQQSLDFAKKVKEANPNYVVEYAPVFDELRPATDPYHYDQDWQMEFFKNNSTEVQAKNPVKRSPILATSNTLFADDSQEDINTNQIITQNKNFFKGWTCNINESLHIFPDGKIQMASCGVGKVVGNIVKGEFDSKAAEPVICPKEHCHCAADINIPKYSNKPAPKKVNVKYEDIKESYCFHMFNTYSCSNRGKIRTCCLTDKSEQYLSGDTLENSLNNENFKRIRKEMLSGNRPKDCSACWDAEDKGIGTLRQIHNEMFKYDIQESIENCTADGEIPLKSIKYLDLTLGNLCNLKCRSCNPYSSSKWAEEGPVIPYSYTHEKSFERGTRIYKKPWFESTFKDGFFDSTISNLKQINFLGGEPLLVKEHYDFLQKIVDQGYSKDIILSYNSNGTFFPNKILNIWKHFRKIDLNLSIDAVDDLAYYVRHPSDFKAIDRNISNLAKHCFDFKNISVQTHVTLSTLNILSLEPVLDWCKKQYESWRFDGADYKTEFSFGYINIFPLFNYVNNPPYLSFNHMPEELKTEALRKLQKIKGELLESKLPKWEQDAPDKIDGIVNYLNQDRDEEKWFHFIENTKALDAHRKVDIREYIPWSKDYF